MNRPALISVFSDQRRTKSTTRSRTSCGTHTLVRAPQDFFLRPCAQPSIRPAPHPSSGSSFPGTRSVVVRLGGPDGSWTGRQPPRSRRTLFANGRTPLAAAPVPHTDRKPALYPANAVLGCQPSLRQCSASALFACVLSVILTEERSLQFQLRQDTLRPLGGCKVVVSAHSSKLLSVGALLAAYEERLRSADVGIAHVESQGYTMPDTLPETQPDLFSLW